MNYYNYKLCGLSPSIQVKDIDESNRKVDIYVSAFGDKSRALETRDSDKQIILPGAFKRTIQHRGPKGANRIKHLKQHIFTEVVGRPVEMLEDAHGLRVISEISNSTAGQDTIEDYKLDLYEHSIGFEIGDREQAKDAELLKEIVLWEYSSVTWGANENTPLNGIKTLAKTNPVEAIERANNRMNVITKALRKGNYTDERFEALDLELKQVQQLYNEIFENYKLKISELESKGSDGLPPDVPAPSDTEDENTRKQKELEEIAQWVKSF